MLSISVKVSVYSRFSIGGENFIRIFFKNLAHMLISIIRLQVFVCDLSVIAT